MVLDDIALREAVETRLSAVPDGYEPRLFAEAAMGAGAPVLVVARDGQRAAMIEEGLAFYAPALEVISVPAWDCLPYDRVSPTATVVSRRLSALALLANPAAGPRLVITTVNALLQKTLTPARIRASGFVLAPGQRQDMAGIADTLAQNGYERTVTVRVPGEFAVRGGILDLFTPGADEPVRLDFFGDTLESIRTFDPESQRTQTQLKRFELLPGSEVRLDSEAIRRFRRAYAASFGAPTKDDALYVAVSEGRRHPGLEHWLGFIEEELSSLIDHLPKGPVIFDALAFEAIDGRAETIRDHYQARRERFDAEGMKAAYKPAPPETLYLTRADVEAGLAGRPRLLVSRFAEEAAPGRRLIDVGGRQGRGFAAERAGEDNVFEAVKEYVSDLRKRGQRVMIAAWSEGSRDRLSQVLGDHGLAPIEWVNDAPAFERLEPRAIGFAVLPIETGFEVGTLTVLAEQDILGERMVRTGARKRRSADTLLELGALNAGDVVVHVDHGIGRFIGLKTIEVSGAPHDCLELQYAGNDKLFVPVENIDLLTRYGAEEAEVTLDRLGGGAWQARKAKLKGRIRDMAEKLIRIAADRAMRTAPGIAPPDGLYDEFAARFPYDETEDQLSAIEAIMDDLNAGKPMDRLVCGDVGFGKTEVALRAAFMVAASGRQVAVVVPTTLLSRQHFRTFEERFKGLPLIVRQLSRFVSAADMSATKKELAEGRCDIVVGTHALLGKAITFKDLGLLIIDEEQHFGVGHKERLKELKSNVHVLTLSATPIPRTLQLALTGVRELSLIATPPVDRLAVRTFVSPHDPLVIRETLLREHFRGGQSFYVCPRVADIDKIKTFLEQTVPEVKIGIAHGQMAAGELEDVMTAFYEGRFDVLLSTTIVESGLDVPTANTLIVHRSDMFGLAQLHQLRGRVGRSKTRAYALFTVPADIPLNPVAERRLKVLQANDTLGAGFQLASHDLDIRGSGNLLGEEQSGHIREVGFELYQQMLEEAVASLRTGDGIEAVEGTWSPQITLGTPVMIPDHYVPDLTLRMQLYRRLGELDEIAEIDAFGAELIDRFGPLPDEVESLIKLVFIKALCRKANVEKVDAGPKGVVIAFRNATFANPAGLVQYITAQGSLAKIRPDQKIVLMRDWPTPDDRVKGTALILTKLAEMATKA